MTDHDRPDRELDHDRPDRELVVTDERDAWYRAPWIWVAVVALGLLLLLLVLALRDRDDIAVVPAPAPTVIEPVGTPTVGETPTTGVAGPAGTTTPSPAALDTQAPEVDVQEAPEPQTLSGAGAGEAGSVEHEGGLALLQLAHDGAGRFAVRLVGEDGEEVELVASDGAGYRGTRAVGLAAGTYRVRVDADGRWGINFQQPRYASGLRPPRALRGRGDTATDPLQVRAGEYRLAWQTEDGNAVAFRILSTAGEPVHEQEAAAEGAVTVRLRQGLYVLDVTSDGVWSIEVS